MNMKEIEAKWQKKWEETGLYKFNKDNVDKNRGIPIENYLSDVF